MPNQKIVSSIKRLYELGALPEDIQAKLTRAEELDAFDRVAGAMADSKPYLDRILGESKPKTDGPEEIVQEEKETGPPQEDDPEPVGPETPRGLPNKAEPGELPKGVQFLQQTAKDTPRQLGLTARALGEGAAGMAGIAVDPISVLFNQFIPEGKQIPTMHSWAKDMLTQAGVPEAETKAEKIVQQIMQAFTGAGLGAGAAKVGSSLIQQAPKAGQLAGQLARSLAEKPGQQIIAAGSGEAARSGAEELGAPIPAQLAANLAGSLASGRVAGQRFDERTAQDLIEESLTPTRKGIAPIVRETEETFKTPVFSSDILPPRSRFWKIWQTLGETIPGTGMGGPRRVQQEARINSIKSLLDDFGVRYIDNASDDVMKDLLDKNSEFYTRMSKLKWEPIIKYSGRGTVPMTKTTAAIKSQIEELKNIGKTGSLDPVISKLETTLEDISGQTLEYVEKNRKRLGSYFNNPANAEFATYRDAITKKVYSAVNEDMGDFIKHHGDKKDFVKWKVGNQRISALKKEADNTILKSILAKGEHSPENIKRMLFSNKPSEVKILSRRLSPEGKQNAKVAVLSHALEKAGGYADLSPAKFATQVKKLGSSIGIFFSGPDLRRIEGLSRALALTKRANDAGLQTPTGMTTLPYAIGSFFTQALGSIELAAVGVLGTGALANILESKGVRNILMKLPKTRSGSIEEAEMFKRLYTVLLKEYPDIENFLPEEEEEGAN